MISGKNEQLQRVHMRSMLLLRPCREVPIMLYNSSHIQQSHCITAEHKGGRHESCLVRDGLLC